MVEALVSGAQPDFLLRCGKMTLDRSIASLRARRPRRQAAGDGQDLQARERDGYTVLTRGKAIIDPSAGTPTTVMDHVAKQGEIAPVEGRITRLN